MVVAMGSRIPSTIAKPWYMVVRHVMWWPYLISLWQIRIVLHNILVLPEISHVGDVGDCHPYGVVVWY
jgi:hypothetical protein